MGNIGNTMKMGFVATPTVTLTCILRWLKAGKEGFRRFFDPCAGEGEALAAVAAHCGPAETYGTELSPYRAEAAAAVLNHVFATAYEYVYLSKAAFSLVWLNPPYDRETMTGGGRCLEEIFLIDGGRPAVMEQLVEGGVLVYIIPHSKINQQIARHLAGWYENLRVVLSAREEYAESGNGRQCIIFGTRKAKYHASTAQDVQQIMAWRDRERIVRWEPVERLVEKATTDGGIRKEKVIEYEPVKEPIPFIDEIEPEAFYTPPAQDKEGHFRFQYNPMTPSALLSEANAAAGRLVVSRQWMDKVPNMEPPTYCPVMTPKAGHVASQILAGLHGTNVVEEDGKPVALKGFLVKNSSTTTKAPSSEEGEVEEETSRKTRGMTRVEVKEYFQSTFTVLDSEGNLTRTSDPGEIGKLMERFIHQLSGVIDKRNKPRYNMNPEEWEFSALANLSKGRALPGRAGTGLTDFQKHLVTAMGRQLLEKGSGFINAEMGSGKTTMGIATSEYLLQAQRRHGSRVSPFPALVVGPGIVTGKENWPKEIREVLPESDSRVIQVGARPHPKPMRIGEYLKKVHGWNLAEDTFTGLDTVQVLSRICVRMSLGADVRKALKESALLRALKQSLLRAEANPPRCRKGAKAPNLLDGRIGGYLWLGQDIPADEDSAKEYAGRYSMAQFAAEYRSGELPEKTFAIMSFETAKLGSGRVPAVAVRGIREYRNGLGRTLHVCACPHCGAVIYDEDTEEMEPVTPGPKLDEWNSIRRRFCQAPVPRRVWNPETKTHDLLENDPKTGLPFVCGAPLFEESALRREAAAEYLRKKAKDLIGLVIFDEVHKAKAAGSGVGWTLGLLAGMARWSLGLTGTLFGGCSTSIFHLWYRMVPAVRNRFGFADSDKWAAQYGLRSSVFYTDKNYQPEDGAFTGTRFMETVKEEPGISPKIMEWGLSSCVFSSLNDIGLPLPDYQEHIVPITMSSEMAEQMRSADQGLFEWAKRRRMEPKGGGAMLIWLNAALNRPNAIFRPEDITFNVTLRGHGKWAFKEKEHVASFPAVCGTQPKETWLTDLVRRERDLGRKVLVYVRQSGTRDIQDNLKMVLEAAGLRVGILRPTVDPRNRATWLKNHCGKIDVMLTNSRLVEVGLNLTMFSSAVFYEIEYSLYVVWQAMRRLYRPGAPKPVHLYFPVYSGTLEEAVIKLVGKKMAAAQKMYGDAVGGALVEEEGASDVLDQLVRSLVKGENLGRLEGDEVMFGNAVGKPSPETVVITAAELIEPELDDLEVAMTETPSFATLWDLPLFQNSLWGEQEEVQKIAPSVVTPAPVFTGSPAFGSSRKRKKAPAAVNTNQPTLF